MRYLVFTAAIALALAILPGAESGAIKGKVTFEGDPPKERPIRMGGDPKCEQIHKGDPMTTQDFVVGADKGLKWVFVYLKEGVEGEFTPPADPVVLDQQGCQYNPHVWGVMVGQKVILKNSDPLLHNVHIIPRTNKEINIGQPVPTEDEHVFTDPEQMVTIKCDIHNWMYSFAGVMAHPFYATTTDDGSFEIKDVPPGTYKLAFWHRRMGEQIVDVTVAEGDLAQDFKFDDSHIKRRKRPAAASGEKEASE